VGNNLSGQLIIHELSWLVTCPDSLSSTISCPDKSSRSIIIINNNNNNNNDNVTYIAKIRKRSHNCAAMCQHQTEMFSVIVVNIVAVLGLHSRLCLGDMLLSVLCSL